MYHHSNYVHDGAGACERKTSPDFLQPWDLSDVSFVVEGKRVYGSRTILAMWSPVMKVDLCSMHACIISLPVCFVGGIHTLTLYMYLQAMFYDDFKEKYSAEIELPDKHFDDILELLMVLHPPNKDLDGT
jgi:hypothetical protein